MHKARALGSGVRPNRLRRAARLLAAAAAAAPLLAAEVASGVNNSWTFNGNGSWTDSTKWLGGVPAGGADVFIFHSDATNRTITYNYAGPPITFNSMTVENTSTGSSLFSQPANTFTALNVAIGNTGTGYWSLGGGTHSCLMTFGGQASGKGTGTLSGGTLDVGGNMVVGNFGDGSFTQTGGTAKPFTLRLGFQGSGSGTYNLSGGTLSVSTVFYLGNAGEGSFSMSGGTLNSVLDIVGDSGVGSFSQTGGNHTIGTPVNQGGISLGGSSGAVGTFLLGGSASLTVNGFEDVGASGTGVFKQSGGGQVIGSVPVPQFLYVGKFPTGAGTYLLSGGTCLLNGSAYIGGSSITSGGAGVLTVNGGSMTVTSLLKLWDTNSSAVNLNGGALSVDALDTNGNPDRFNWTLGTLAVTRASGLTIGSTGPLGTVVDLKFGKALVVPSTLTVASGGNLSLSGGSIITSALVKSGGGQFLFTGGFLQLTGSNFVVGAAGQMGATATIGPTMRVETTGGANQCIVDSSALLNLAGGTVFAAGGVTNNGQITLGSPSARLSGAVLTNDGRIQGTGQIDNTLSNSAGGVVRAATGENLLFTAAGSANSGSIQLVGGIIEFQQALTNNPAGFVGGQGSLYMTGGLTNDGSITLSGGVTNFFGPLTNSSTGSVLITGGSESTFYDAVTNNAGSQFKVSTASIATFLGPVNGLAAFTGPGTKIFEGPASFGPLLTTGSSIVSPSGSLTAQHVREIALEINGVAQIVPNGTSAGTSKVQSLTIAGSPGAWTGKLDLNDNDLVIDYTGASPLATVRDQIRSGRAGGSWTGNGITSSLANASKFALGYGEASALGLSSFSGQSVDSTSVLVKYTYYGDADLDGDADGVDIGKWATNFTGELGGGAGATKLWTQGDWDYDGDVDGVDAGLWATAFTGELGGGGLGGIVVTDPALTHEAVAILQGLGIQVVPEPAAIISLGSLSLLRRRRRR